MGLANTVLIFLNSLPDWLGWANRSLNCFTVIYSITHYSRHLTEHFTYYSTLLTPRD